jgi:hypothetical protein
MEQLAAGPARVPAPGWKSSAPAAPATTPRCGGGRRALPGALPERIALTPPPRPGHRRRQCACAALVSPQREIEGADSALARHHTPFRVPWTLPQRPDPNVASNRVLEGAQLLSAQKQITRIIKSAAHWSQLRDAVAEYGPLLNTIHVTAVLTSLAKLPAPSRPDAAFDAFAQNLVDWVGLYHVRFDGRGLVNSLWAMARLGRTPAARGVADVVEQLQPRLAGLKPQELSNALWALATLQQVPEPAWLQAWLQAASAALPGARPQELCNGLWALARISQLQQGRQPLPAAPWGLWTARLQEVLPGCSTAELVNAVWALAVLGAAPLPEPLQQQVLAAVLAATGRGAPQRQQEQEQAQEQEQKHARWRWHRRQQGASAHDVAQFLWSANRLGMRLQEQQWQQLLAHVQLPGCGAHTMYVLLHAVAASQHRPGRAWLAAAAQQCSRQPVPGSRQAAVDTLWAVAKLGMQPEAAWLGGLLQQLGEQAGGCSPGQLSSIAWSLACLAADGATAAEQEQHEQQEQQQEQQQEDLQQQEPEEPELLAGSASSRRSGQALQRLPAPAAGLLAALEARSLATMQLHSSRELSTLLWSYARLGRPPSAEWREACFSALGQQLQGREASMACITAVAGALAALHISPSGALLRQLESALVARLPGCSSGELSAAVAAFAQLRRGLSHRTAQRVLRRAGELLPSASCRDLSQLLWALGRLGCRPDDAWLHEVLAALLPMLQAPPEGASSPGGSPGGSPGSSPSSSPSSSSGSGGGPAARRQGNARDLAQLLWALGRFEFHPGHAALVALTARALALCARARPQALTTMLWSLAHLHALPSSSSMQGMLAAAAEALPSSSPSEGISMLWSLSQLAHCDLVEECPIDQPALEGFVAQLQPRLRACSAAELLVLVFILARHGYSASGQLLPELRAAAALQAGQLAPAKQALLRQMLQRLEELQEC